ncbi:MAG: hypothetical protein ACTHLN_11745, partial [Tepidisphaeraceae bacterium]
MSKSSRSRLQTRIEPLEGRTLLSYSQPLGLPDVAPTSIVAFDGTFWFSSIQNGGVQLYRSDGTAAGTSTTAASLPSLQRTYITPTNTPIVLGDRMFVIQGSDELWVTDGTEAGTHSLATAAPHMFTGGPLTDDGPWGQIVDGKLYFIATGSGGKQELFTSDGTLAGTHSVSASIASSGSVASISGVAGSTIYFTLDSGSTSRLASFNGTSVQVVSSFNTGVTNPHAFDLQQLNSTQSLFALPTGQGYRLWITDSAAAHTEPLTTSLLYVGGLSVLNNVAYFLGTTGTGGNASIYRTDGTSAGTYKVADTALSTAYAGKTAHSVQFASRLYFQPEYYNGGGTVFVISPDGSVQSLGSYPGDLKQDGNKLWLGYLGAYVSDTAPLSPVTTDADVVGSPDAELNGKFLYTAKFATDVLPQLYVWDSNSTPPGSVSGTVWNDINGNGTHDGGEPAVAANVGVRLDLSALGDPRHSNVTATTDSQGHFILPVVPAGTWPITVYSAVGQVVAVGSSSVTVT